MSAKATMFYPINILYSSTSQFAYHEATYFVIRLLQQFTGFTLEKSENLSIPADWAGCDGLKGTEKVCPSSHLTMYVKASLGFLDQHLCEGLMFCLGRPLGADAASEVLGGLSFDSQNLTDFSVIKWFSLQSSPVDDTLNISSGNILSSRIADNF